MNTSWACHGGVRYTTDNRWDILPDDEGGFLLRENTGDPDAPCWEPRGAFPSPEAAQAATQASPVVVELADIIEDAPEGAAFLPARYGIGEDALGYPCLWIIFPTHFARSAFIRRWWNTWVGMPDRAAKLDYCLTWHDVQGYALNLTTTRHPLESAG
jgi:hypothetical protein